MCPTFRQRIYVEKSNPLTGYSPVLLNWRGSFFTSWGHGGGQSGQSHPQLVFGVVEATPRVELGWPATPCGENGVVQPPDIFLIIIFLF
jgi:hypothetical protein